MANKQLYNGIIYIICEGEETENNFINDFDHQLQHLRYFRYAEGFKIVPYPKKKSDNDNLIGARIAPKRQMKGDKLEPVFTGEPPVKWVKAGIEALKKFSEVWLVFDNDYHSGRAEAFQMIKNCRAKDVENNLNVAYSSLSFEYYMLQHFNYLYYRFEKTEHRIGKEKQNCCRIDTPYLPKDGACQGELDNVDMPACIEGYARKQGYWTNSKIGGTFSMMRNIWAGICNSSRVKWESIDAEFKLPVNERRYVYDLNPYLNTYHIMLRMMDMKSVEPGTVVEESGFRFWMESSSLYIKNISNRTNILAEKDSFICNYHLNNNLKLEHTNMQYSVIGTLGRKVLNTGQTIQIDLSEYNQADFFIITNTCKKSIFINANYASCQYDKAFLENYHISGLLTLRG